MKEPNRPTPSPNDSAPTELKGSAGTILPVQTTFRNITHSDAVVTRIQEETDKLTHFFDRITSCHVIVEAPPRAHLHAEPFHVHITLGVPGRDLVVTHEPPWRAAARKDTEAHLGKHQEIEVPHKDLYLAIHDSFKTMRRQLQDYVHCLRHEIKSHHEGSHDPGEIGEARF